MLGWWKDVDVDVGLDGLCEPCMAWWREDVVRQERKLPGKAITGRVSVSVLCLAQHLALHSRRSLCIHVSRH